MNQKIRSIKEIHKYDLCLFKVGAFYHAYGRDSYILAYLFDYKLKDTSLEKGWKECGFPITNVSKIMARLEEKKINYILIDRRNNYDVDGKMDFGNLNRYQATYEKSNKYVNHKKRIEGINNFLLENLENKEFSSILNKVEDVIISERRKI